MDFSPIGLLSPLGNKPTDQIKKKLGTFNTCQNYI